MPTPAPSPWSPIRRRRFFVFIAILIAFLFLYGVPWELPPSLRDAGIEALSRANIVHHAKAQSHANKVDEIYGLLYMVTEDADRVLTNDGLDPLEPLNMTAYAGEEEINWPGMVKKLNIKYPVIVFSKCHVESFHRYSRRAKKLLETYNLQPAPKIIEVDLRPDDDVIKAILGRLTGHYTFPNIFLRGRSIGGSDDLQDLHAQRMLTKVLEQAGAAVRDDGSGK
ncbi:hypothetical protein H0H92_007921 [Tricholoma furcatifolium]|nr:hypothetical protein H0H92_007921 [Tricholoma furcatifolium]